MGCAESTSSSSAVENDSSRKVQQQASRNAVDEDKDQACGKGVSGEDLIPPPSGARLAMVNPFSSSATSNLMESTSSLLSNGSAVKRVTFEVLQGGSSATSSHAGTPRSGNSEEPAISMFPIYGQHQKGSNKGGSQAEELCFPPVSMPQRPRSMSSGVQEGDLHGPVFTGPGVGLQHIVPSAPVAVFSNQPSTNQTTTSDGQSAQGDPFMNSDSLRQQVLVGGGVVGPTRPLGLIHVPGAATLTGAIPTVESNSVQAWLVGASKPKVMPLVGQSNIHNNSSNTAGTAPLDTLLSPSFADKEPERPPVPGPHGMMISISSNQLGSQEEGLSISELPAGAERDPGDDAGQGYQYPALKPAGNATCTTATAGPTVGGDAAVDPQGVSEPSEVQLTPIALQQHNKIMSRAGKQLSGTELQQGGGY